MRHHYEVPFLFKYLQHHMSFSFSISKSYMASLQGGCEGQLKNVYKMPGRLGMVAHAHNPSTVGGGREDHLRSRNRDQPGQHGETPSLIKI